MRRSVLALVVTLSLLASGCASGGPAPSPAEPRTTPTSAEPSSPPAREGTTAEYVVRAGSIPDDFGSVTVTFRVVFVTRPADLGPCYPDVFSGPYKPTLTPLPTPGGDCHRSDPIRVDLDDSGGEWSLGTFAVPDSTRGHALVATAVTATRRNGTSVTAIRGTGGSELVSSEGRPDGRYGIELGVEPAPDDARYDYWLVSQRFEPSD